MSKETGNTKTSFARRSTGGSYAAHRAVRDNGRLVIIGQNRASVLQRWPIWPETAMSLEHWQCFLRMEFGQDAKTRRLCQLGLLHTIGDRLVPSLPIYEQARGQAYQERLQVWGKEQAKNLTPFAARIQSDWRALAAAPAWEEVAHNLLLGFWLANCGSQLLLANCQAPAASLLIVRPGSMPGIWLSSLRLAPNLAVVDLVGRAYPGAERLWQLLRRPEVMRSLASGDSAGKLIIEGDSTLSLLRALSAYRQTSQGPWQPNDYWLTWPTLNQELVTALRPALALANRALRLSLQTMFSWLTQLQNPWQWRREDIGLLALIDLIGLLQAEWVQAGLLPPVERPWLDSNQGSSPSSPQPEMLKGLGKE